MVLFQRKLYFSKDPEGVHIFPGEVQLLGGGGLSSLWIRTCFVTCLKVFS